MMLVETPKSIPDMVWSTVLGLTPGAVGGVCNIFTGHPIDLVKVRQQTASASNGGGLTVQGALGSCRVTTTTTTTKPPTSTWGMLRHIAVHEGLPGLYAGVSAPLVAVVPAFAVTFWSYDFAEQYQKQHYPRKNKTAQDPYDLTMTQVALAGGFSGIPLALIVGPVERVKCLMQVDRSRYAGFFDCARQVYREGGLRSVFRGTSITMLRDVPGNACYFWGYQFFKRTLEPAQSQYSPALSTLVTLVAGGMAGVTNWIVAIPMDVLKSRWQTAAPGEYQNARHVLQVLLEREGPLALYRGLAPALLRAFPANAACLVGVETTQAAIDAWSQR